jgi:type VI secretion system protein ImpK
MRKDIADLVYPVLTRGLRLKEQLMRGEDLNLHNEQAALLSLLKSDAEAGRWPEYGGDSTSGGSRRGAADVFLGIRYALVCWLDDIFILDSPWADEWNENKLETALYGINDRAWKFWDQAKRAEARAGSDALEVFLLCVMLGFRGDWHEQPDRVQAWRDTVEAQIAQHQQKEWVGPPDRQLPPDVPPLHGARRLQNMVFAVGLTVLVLIPACVFFLVTGLQK